MHCSDPTDDTVGWSLSWAQLRGAVLLQGLPSRAQGWGKVSACRKHRCLSPVTAVPEIFRSILKRSELLSVCLFPIVETSCLAFLTVTVISSELVPVSQPVFRTSGRDCGLAAALQVAQCSCRPLPYSHWELCLIPSCCSPPYLGFPILQTAVSWGPCPCRAALLLCPRFCCPHVPWQQAGRISGPALSGSDGVGFIPSVKVIPPCKAETKDEESPPFGSV